MNNDSYCQVSLREKRACVIDKTCLLVSGGEFESEMKERQDGNELLKINVC